MNLSCVICADLLSASQDVFATLCGHIFHHACLMQWLERSKSCPQCRHKCLEKNVHKIYFNIANLDTSTLDIGTIQQQLDDMKLQMIQREKELKKSVDEIDTLKVSRKKCMKTVSGLEKELAKEKFLVFSYEEQLKSLRAENRAIDELRKENKELKTKSSLMNKIQDVLTSTQSEVESMIKDNPDIKTLSVLLVTMKRELRISENKKNELRDTLKSTQNDLRREQKLKESLQEKISSLESANYRLEEQVKSLEESNHVDLTVNEIPATPREHGNSLGKLKRPLPHMKDSPNISERIKIIEDSNSPYFNIKSSSIGLTKLLKTSESLRNKEQTAQLKEKNSSSSGALRKTTSDLSEKYSIFKKPRLEMQITNQLKPHHTHMSYNGIGGSEKNDDTFFDFAKRKPICEMKMKSASLSERLKGGKLKRLPVPTTSSEKVTLDNFVTKNP